MNEPRQISEIVEGALQGVLDCNCSWCDVRPPRAAAANRVRDAWERRLTLTFSAYGEEGVKQPPVSREAAHALRMLARSVEPIPGAEFDRVLGLDDRKRKELMRELRNEWLLPVCATRTKPFGYYVATTLEQLLEWGRVTRSQAVNELAVWYRVLRANAPELAGQQSIEFIDQISTELTEAIR